MYRLDHVHNVIIHFVAKEKYMQTKNTNISRTIVWQEKTPVWREKTPQYWVEIRDLLGFWQLCLRGRNKFLMTKDFPYESKRVAVQQGKRLAESLGLRFKVL